jgi:hypothetical protein
MSLQVHECQIESDFILIVLKSLNEAFGNVRNELVCVCVCVCAFY